MVKKLLFVVLCFGVLSCSKKTETVNVDTQGTYFSIIDFTKDQWDTYKGNAFPMRKKVSLNGEIDSTYTTALDVDWASVLKVFFETDISDPKFLGKYRFSTFNDNVTMTTSYYYEAEDDALYTKTLQIMVDYYTDKVKSIYIEAQKKTRLGTKDVKLFYVPLDVISIQESEATKTGQKKDLRIEYDFD
ncbi:MAG: hypothetical protein H6551_10865 [Chitinophagales bacterium]|nr:hypothetical protein [Chitinophagaceae bacterium]MCB9065626.1 hypothetical protein [Chitinophagales bacterium]